MTDFAFENLRLPIFQAPMGGGITTPKLVSTVSNYGAVGGFGFAYTGPEKIHKAMQETKKLTDGYINANFFVYTKITLPKKEIQKACVEALANLPIEEEIELKIPRYPFFFSLEEQLDPIWKTPPSILTFHFGIPPYSIIDKAKSLGIKIGITATNKAEAVSIEAVGADFIVAQGFEAGGHRGVFDLSLQDDRLEVDKLLKDLKTTISIPIIAAGGIMTGADINRVIRNGAIAAQMGTAFLCCEEAGTSPTYKDSLLNHQNRRTVFTHAFSGRPARGLENTFTKLMENKPFLPFPAQNLLTNKLRKLAEKNKDGELISLWAGKNYQKINNKTCLGILNQLNFEFNNP